MELSRRINLRLSAEQLSDVAAFARQRSLRGRPAMRLRIAQALHGETPGGAVTPLHAVAAGDAATQLKKGVRMPKRARVVRNVHRHQVQVRFSDEVYGALGEFASQRDVNLNCSVRELVERGLATEGGSRSNQLSATSSEQLKALGITALACLIAIEQTQKLVAGMLPEGAERAEELWEEAATSARSRLIRIDRALAEETA